MGRHKDPIPSEHIRFEGNRKRGVSRRDDRVFEWLDAIPAGADRFGVAWELIAAALNGELGPTIKQAVETSDTEKARAAARAMFASMIVDDE
jgi:hypothetical protein